MCAKLTAQQAKHLHGFEGDRCWNSSVCPSRRSHARHRDRRNQARNLKRWSKQGQVVMVARTAEGIALTDSEIAPIQEQSTADTASSRNRIQFETQLPSFNYSAVLQVYRQSVDCPIHAVGGEIWYGTRKEADISPIHCNNLTPRQVEIYLERLLKKLTEVYSIHKFTSKEELHPKCCSLPGCQENS